jgi:hypothetical protein
VIAGYVGALAVALAIVWAYATLHDTPDRQASSGMSAFGDSLMFLALFGVGSVVPTGAALFFLRPYPSFWRGLAVVSVFLGLTGIAAGIVYAAGQVAGVESAVHAWTALAILRILVAPLVGLAFLVGAVASPHRPARIALAAVTLAEWLIFGCVAAFWTVQLR